MDAYAIAQSLAAVLTAVTPPTGEDAKTVHEVPPDGLGGQECIVIWLPTEEQVPGPGSKDRSVLRYPVKLYLTSETDTPKGAKRLYAWHKALRFAVGSSVHLGRTDVAYAAVETINLADPEGAEFEGNWDVLSMIVAVRISEGVTFGA